MKRGRGFYREVVTLATPILLQNLITSMLGMADTFMVGTLGEVSMAAVTLANIPLFAIQVFIFGIQSGSTVLISQYWGHRDTDSMVRVIGTATWIVLCISGLAAAIFIICPVQFLSFFNNQEEVVVLAAKYARYAALSLIFNGPVMVYITAYRSMGRPSLGTYILVSSMSVNVVLNWIFIFGHFGAPAMGVEGAAFATLLSRILELIIMTIHASVTKGFRLKPRLMIFPGWEMFRRFVLYGGPVVLNESLWGIGSSVFPTIMGHMNGSTEILAAYAISGNVNDIFMVFSFGLGAAASIIIGREVGAGRTEEVKPIGLVLDTLAFLTGAGTGCLLFIFAVWVAPAVVYPLFKLSPEAGSIATMMMVVLSIFRPLRDFNGVNIVGVLRGGGDVKMATCIDILPLWLVAIPAAFFCGIILRTSITVVFLMISLEQVVKCILGVTRVRSDGWIRDLTQASLGGRKGSK